MRKKLIFIFILFFIVSCWEEDYSNDTIESHDYACLSWTDESYNWIMPCSLFDPGPDSRAKNWKTNKIWMWIEE